MNPKTPIPPREEDADARQIEAQFGGLDNDLVEIEAADGRPEPRDESLSDGDIDETSAGGLDYPPEVRTSRSGSGR